MRKIVHPIGFRVKRDSLSAAWWIACCLVCFSSCAPRATEGDADLAVAVSIPPLAFLVERIGGAHIDVTTLARPGESPATYQPTDRQVSRVMRAKVYFRIGVPFEQGSWLDALKSSGKALRIVDLREGITLREFSSPDAEGHDAHGADPRPVHACSDAGCGHHHGGADPHIWLSPELLKVQAQTIRDVLCELDPARAEEYTRNLKSLHTDLDDLHAELRARLAPFKGKAIYLYHPAWGYFCDAYGLMQVPIEIEGKEPTDAELTRLQARLRADKAQVIFVQPQISGQSVQAVAQAAGLEVRTLDPLAGEVLKNLREAGQAIAESFP